MGRVVAVAVICLLEWVDTRVDVSLKIIVPPALSVPRLFWTLRAPFVSLSSFM